MYTRDLLPAVQPSGTRVYVVNTVSSGPEAMGTGHWIGVLDTAGRRYFHDSLGTLRENLSSHEGAIRAAALSCHSNADDRWARSASLSRRVLG